MPQVEQGSESVSITAVYSEEEQDVQRHQANRAYSREKSWLDARESRDAALKAAGHTALGGMTSQERDRLHKKVQRQQNLDFLQSQSGMSVPDLERLSNVALMDRASAIRLASNREYLVTMGLDAADVAGYDAAQISTKMRTIGAQQIETQRATLAAAGVEMVNGVAIQNAAPEVVQAQFAEHQAGQVQAWQSQHRQCHCVESQH